MNFGVELFPFVAGWVGDGEEGAGEVWLHGVALADDGADVGGEFIGDEVLGLGDGVMLVAQWEFEYDLDGIVFGDGHGGGGDVECGEAGGVFGAAGDVALDCHGRRWRAGS